MMIPFLSAMAVGRRRGMEAALCEMKMNRMNPTLEMPLSTPSPILHSGSRIVAALCGLSSLAAFAGEPALLPPEETLPPNSSDEFSFSDLWTPTLDLRLRLEYGDQDPLEESHAETLRARVGAKLNEWNGFTGLIELEGTIAADNGSYRAASVDGPPDHTVIADPESVEMNQLWLGYTAWETTLKIGRQRIIRDNARFVGNVGWRQNEQTFDAVDLSTEIIPDTTLSYTYVNRVNRIFGSQSKAAAGQNDFDGDSHFFNGAYTGIPNTKIAAYAYLLDLENKAGHAQSNNTFGLSLSGTYPLTETIKVKFLAEYAHQTDAFDSPLDYEADYYHVFVGGIFEKVDFGVGFESLGTDDGVPFRTPLATLHAFNGFADKFLGTPPGGLQDFYVSGGVKLPAGFALKLAYHHFFADDDSFGADSYGDEIDLVLVKKITDDITFLTKFAYYDADEFATDTTRFSTELNFKF